MPRPGLPNPLYKPIMHMTTQATNNHGLMDPTNGPECHTWGLWICCTPRLADTLGGPPQGRG